MQILQLQLDTHACYTSMVFCSDMPFSDKLCGILLIRINSATDDEGQIMEEIVNRSLCAVEQQMKLKELDEKHQNSIFALREDQHKTLLEVHALLFFFFFFFFIIIINVSLMCATHEHVIQCILGFY
jgi:hypothetical protein